MSILSIFRKIRTGVRSFPDSCSLLVPSLFFFATSCSIVATRPLQEMSDTAAAIKAAREVKADTLAPELYRESTEWFIKARQEYRFKNFEEARNYAKKARRFAEEAEFEAIRSGASRTDAVIPDSLSDRGMSGSSAETNEPPLTPNEYATPTGIPADENLRSSPDETDTTPPSAPLPTPSN